MLISRNSKTLTAALLVLSLAACTTTKKADESAGAFEQSAAEKAAADKAAADAAAASAASTENGVDSQALSNANAGTPSGAAALDTKTFYFDYDNTAVQNSDYEALRAHAQYLSKNSSARVQISGNTDERGTREYNMALGERRAKTVAAFLTSNGASASQLELISYGEEKPATVGESEEVWAKNRRVDLEYTSGRP